MKSYDVLGCTDGGAAFCEDHCPDSANCLEPIEHVTVIHGNHDPCEYCAT